ncbi:hypothetical protein EG832_12195 [bacterium]|nr:hypothetical protein [bacterium]
MILFFLAMITLIVFLCFFSNSNQLIMMPLTTPEQFLINMPHIKMSLFSHDLIFIQPSSSIFVYTLGLLMIVIGVFFVASRGIHKSRSYWGIGLILWGISAIVAGTSYQAFGYELKCAEREYCLFTSNFELVYMLLTAFSINFLVAATAFTSLGALGRKKLILFAVVDAVLYFIYLFIGAMTPIKFLISYEGFMAFIGVNFVFMFILNIRHYKKYKDPLNKGLITIWIGFLVVNIGYFVFLFGQFGQKLYSSTGIWFNENDALHVLLIIWAIIILWILRKKLVDTNS